MEQHKLKPIFSTPIWETVDSNYGMILGPMRSVMRYDPCDPSALKITFDSVGCATHSDYMCKCSDDWEFARDLFIFGLDAPSGLGDVMFEPSIINGTTYLQMSLSDGNHVMSAITPRPRMYTFMQRVIKLVPIGKESQFIDMDDVIAKILAKEERRK